MVREFDHIAITVADLDSACDFYAEVLDARIEDSYEINRMIAVRRIAIGRAVMNIHQQGNGVELVARQPLPGSADICFRWDGDVAGAKRHLEARQVEVIEGPVRRIAADGKLGASVYFRDPDGNLLELLAA